jgi:uncharacterized protein YjbI with pentapeptide repeats
MKKELIRKVSNVYNKNSIDFNLGSRLILLAVSILILIAWFKLFPGYGNDYRIEFVGLIFDIVFILLIFSFFERSGRKQQDIKRQEEIIEDYKRWDNEEARFRLAGSIRRLNRLGKCAINFTGLRLSNFVFTQNDIASIEGSTFYDGSWGEPTKNTEVKLNKVGFDWLNCRNVTFSPGEMLVAQMPALQRSASFSNCSFISTNLTGAIFDGAQLEWSDVPPESLYEYEGENEDGSPILLQAYYGPFHEANLSHVSFEYVRFKNADFREAEHIEQANFYGATGLEASVFDSQEIKDFVLKAAQRSEEVVR